MTENTFAVLLLSCPDREGLVYKLAGFVSENGGNITDLDEHVDNENSTFFIRIKWNMKNFKIPKEQLNEQFKVLGDELNADWKINFSDEIPRLAIFVSKYDHCLLEILWRHKLGEFNAEIPLIISNHDDLKPLADQYSIPFHVFPVNKENKTEAEQEELKLLKENNIDSIVLARYMQILSPGFLSNYNCRIINIHHSFLPAFMGGNPYKQAYQKGVKIIGATSHFVTPDLDEGPIIEQDVIRISHKDSLKDLIRKGRDLERLVLARAIELYLDNRILSYGNKTIIF